MAAQIQGISCYLAGKKVVRALVKKYGKSAWDAMPAPEKVEKVKQYHRDLAANKEAELARKKAEWDALPQYKKDRKIRERERREREAEKMTRETMAFGDAFDDEFIKPYRSPAEQKQDKLWDFWTQKLADSLNQQGGVPAI